MITKHFNVREYFDQHSAQSKTILKFQYIERLLCPLVTHSETKM